MVLEKGRARGKLLGQVRPPFTSEWSLENGYAREVCDTQSSTLIT